MDVKTAPNYIFTPDGKTVYIYSRAADGSDIADCPEDADVTLLNSWVEANAFDRCYSNLKLWEKEGFSGEIDAERVEDLKPYYRNKILENLKQTNKNLRAIAEEEFLRFLKGELSDANAKFPNDELRADTVEAWSAILDCVEYTNKIKQHGKTGTIPNQYKDYLNFFKNEDHEDDDYDENVTNKIEVYSRLNGYVPFDFDENLDPDELDKYELYCKYHKLGDTISPLPYTFRSDVFVYDWRCMKKDCPNNISRRSLVWPLKDHRCTCGSPVVISSFLSGVTPGGKKFTPRTVEEYDAVQNLADKLIEYYNNKTDRRSFNEFKNALNGTQKEIYEEFYQDIEGEFLKEAVPEKPVETTGYTAESRSSRLFPRCEEIQGDIYDGEFEKGEWTGYGTIQFDDGRWYNGSIIRKTMTGKGTLIDGDMTYIGDFENGYLVGPNGYLECRKDPQYTYRGAFSENSPSGRGKYTFLDGRTFEGEFETGEVTGTNVKVTFGNPNIIYQGDVKNKNLAGRVTIVDKKSGLVTFIGNWENGVMTTGNGLLAWKSGTYEGAWKDGVPHTEENPGEYLWEGNAYVGHFKNGIFEGKGHLNRSDGTFQDGYWVTGVFWSGTAKGRLLDGSLFEGTYDRGLPVSGRITCINGDVYTGDSFTLDLDPHG